MYISISGHGVDISVVALKRKKCTVVLPVCYVWWLITVIVSKHKFKM